MSEHFYLTIDQGGHASRASLFDHSLTLVNQAACDIQTLRPKACHVEHDPQALLQSINTAIEQTVSTTGLPSGAIIVAGIACQRSSIACWDRSTSQPLSNIISWQDTRASESVISQKDLSEITGLRPSAHYGASKIQWCTQHLSDVKNTPSSELAIAPLMSYLLFNLLQEVPYTSDPINASRTNLFNIHTNAWQQSLLTDYGLTTLQLPTIHPCQHNWGRLHNGTPLNIATGDQSAALFSLGPPKPENLYINMGTVCFLQQVIPKPLNNPDPLLNSLAMSTEQDKIFVLEGTVNGAGSAIDWFIKDRSYPEFFDTIALLLTQQVNPGICLNGISGLGSPDWKPAFTPVFIDSTGINNQAVALLESILFLLQRNIDAFSSKIEPAQNIILSGGFSQQNSICQRLSDLSQKRVYRYSDAEATSRGLAYLLNPIDKYSFKPCIFSPKKNTALMSRYQKWTTAMHIHTKQMI